jgi:exosome complex exonuclease RRP6
LTTALDHLTTDAAALPDKSDLSFHRTMDRKFAKQLDEASSKVLGMAEQMLKLVLGPEQNESKAGAAVKKGKARRTLADEDDVVDGFRGAVIDVVDGLLEDAVR